MARKSSYFAFVSSKDKLTKKYMHIAKRTNERSCLIKPYAKEGEEKEDEDEAPAN